MKGQKCKHTLTHMYRQINQKDIEEDGDEEDRILVFFSQSILMYIYLSSVISKAKERNNNAD